MKRLLSVTVLAGLSFLPATAMAQNVDKPGAKPVTVRPAEQPKKERGGDDATRLEAYEKAGQPGPNHKLLAQFEGTWNAEVKEFGPAGSGEPTRGVMHSKLVMDGRFLHSEYEGKMHGKAFRGAGTLGYNNAEKRFEGTSAENLSTAQSFTTGSADKDGKVFTMTGEFTDPVTGAKATQKQVTTVADKDHYKMEFYFTGKDGKETKVMEISYTRGKEGKDERGKDKDNR